MASNARIDLDVLEMAREMAGYVRDAPQDGVHV